MTWPRAKTVAPYWRIGELVKWRQVSGTRSFTHERLRSFLLSLELAMARLRPSYRMHILLFASL